MPEPLTTDPYVVGYHMSSAVTDLRENEDPSQNEALTQEFWDALGPFLAEFVTGSINMVQDDHVVVVWTAHQPPK